MKEYIRFFMRDKRLDVTLPIEQAERVIDSPAQLVKVLDKDGRWSGRTINKADVMGTEHDYDEEKHANYNRNQIEAPKVEPMDTEKFRPDFLKDKKEIIRTPADELKRIEKELKKGKDASL